MTREEFAGVVASIGLPAAYYQFEEGTDQAPPFICYFYTGRTDFFADSRNYSHIAEAIVELYTETKDPEAEAMVETALEEAGLTYTTNEAAIESEKLYQVAYTMEVLLNE